MPEDDRTGPSDIFVGVNREENPPRLSDPALRAQWEAGIAAAMEKARANVREGFDVNVWGKKP